MANSCPQRAGPGPGPLTDVVLTSVGGLGVKGRGEGVVWVGELLWASDSVKRKETNHCSQGRGALFGGSGGRTGVLEFLKAHSLRFL